MGKQTMAGIVLDKWIVSDMIGIEEGSQFYLFSYSLGSEAEAGN